MQMRMLCLIAGLTAGTLATELKNVLYIVSDDLRLVRSIIKLGHRAESATARGQLTRVRSCVRPIRHLQPVTQLVHDWAAAVRHHDMERPASFRDYPLSVNWTTMPGVFKDQGFLTLGVGKLFHDGQPANGDGTRSWTDWRCSGTRRADRRPSLRARGDQVQRECWLGDGRRQLVPGRRPRKRRRGVFRRRERHRHTAPIGVQRGAA